MASDLSFEEELTDFLLDDSRIQSAIRSRISPLPFPQGSKVPRITYTEVSREDGQTQTGPDCLAAHHWELDCWAKTYGDMRELGELVRKRLNGYDGPMGGYTRVSFFMVNRQDTFEDESKLHRGILEFIVWYREEL